MSGVYQNEFSVLFDFRFDGFQAGETEQVVFKSNTFLFKVILDSGQVKAVAFQGEEPTLIFPGVQVGLWYRALWSVTSPSAGQHFLWLRPWSARYGWYSAGDTDENCHYRLWSGGLASPGDVWIGHDGGSDASLYFHGRLDNVSIVNYLIRNRPAHCTLHQ